MEQDFDVVTVLWEHPTPHEQSLAQIDNWIRNPHNLLAMVTKARRYGGTVRWWALRELRIGAAIARIQEMREALPVPKAPESANAAGASIPKSSSSEGTNQ